MTLNVFLQVRPCKLRTTMGGSNLLITSYRCTKDTLSVAQLMCGFHMTRYPIDVL
jgi:hypothetical protein